MRKWRNLRYSLRTLWRFRSRTLLTASGMAIGIVALAVLLGLGAGARRAFQEALEQMGENLLAVNAGSTRSDALRGDGRKRRTLDLADWRAIVDELPSVERAAPVAEAALTLRAGRRSLATTVKGTTPEFRLTNNLPLAAGRFLDVDDVAEARRVAVVGAHVVRELFFGEWPLGERLSIGGAPFVVVGILGEKGAGPTAADEDNQVLIPIATAERRLLDVDYLDRIFVTAASRPAVATAAREIRRLLRDRHGIDEPGEEEDFEIQDQAALLATQTATEKSFSRWIAALAVLTLGLGGIGLLAVSLLSVKERQGEIGLRLAVGALPRHVVLQFLVEASLIAALGAAAGLIAGGGAIIMGQRLIAWQLALTWKSVVFPFLISLGIALAFGVYPALRAARLDPIVALRSG